MINFLVYHYLSEIFIELAILLLIFPVLSQAALLCSAMLNHQSPELELFLKTAKIQQAILTK